MQFNKDIQLNTTIAGSTVIRKKPFLTKYRSRVRTMMDRTIPDEFSKQNQGLFYVDQQPSMLNSLAINRPQILVCITIYNQPQELIRRSLDGLWHNLKHFQAKGISSSQIAVLIVQDGITKLVNDFKTRELSSTVDFFGSIFQKNGQDSNPIKQRINIILDQYDYLKHIKKPVDYNVLPRTVRKRTSLYCQAKYVPQGISLESCPFHLNLLLCFKHTNGKKLSSHLWYFEGFCQTIVPKYCCILDAGTKPTQKGLLNFYLSMQKDQKYGAICGLLRVQQIKNNQQAAAQIIQSADSNQNFLVKAFTNTFNYIQYGLSKVVDFVPLARAQQFQYNMSHIVDKSFECFFKFAHVMPGAWSFYRYEALSHTDNQKQLSIIQRDYLKTIVYQGYTPASLNEEIMYLAEDRILCLSIFSLKNKTYKLGYNPEAEASTDAPQTLYQLLQQRKRWMNSSYFAFQHVYNNYTQQLQKSQQGFFTRNIFIPFLMHTTKANQILGHLSPALYFYILYNCVFSLIGTFFCSLNILYQQREYFSTFVNSIKQSGFTDSDIIPLNNWNAMFKLMYTKQIQSWNYRALNGLTKSQALQKVKSLYDSKNAEYLIQYQNFAQLKSIGVLVLFVYVAVLLYFIFHSVSLKLKRDSSKRIRTIKALITILSIFHMAIEAFILVFMGFKFFNDFSCDNSFTTKVYFLGSERNIFFIWAFMMLLIYYGASLLPVFVNLIFNPKFVLQTLLAYPSSFFYRSLYSHVFFIFGIANLDDLSWGTKGLQQKDQNLSYILQKNYYIKLFLFMNVLLIATFMLIQKIVNTDYSYFILVIGLICLIPQIIRYVFATLHALRFYLYENLKNQGICFD